MANSSVQSLRCRYDDLLHWLPALPFSDICCDVSQSTWKWSQESSGAIIADVAYDLFTSSSPTGNNEHEIMVWLGIICSGINLISRRYLPAHDLISEL